MTRVLFPKHRNFKIVIYEDLNGTLTYYVKIQWRFLLLFHIPIWSTYGMGDKYSSTSIFKSLSDAETELDSLKRIHNSLSKHKVAELR